MYVTTWAHRNILNPEENRLIIGMEIPAFSAFEALNIAQKYANRWNKSHKIGNAWRATEMRCNGQVRSLHKDVNT